MKDKPKTIYNAYTQGQFYTGDSVHNSLKNEHGDTFAYWSTQPSSNEDMVNSPPHYANGTIECIDAMGAMLTPEEFIGYLRGNAFKYMWRFRNKGKAYEDLQKSQWYVNRLVSLYNPR